MCILSFVISRTPAIDFCGCDLRGSSLAPVQVAVLMNIECKVRCGLCINVADGWPVQVIHWPGTDWVTIHLNLLPACTEHTYTHWEIITLMFYSCMTSVVSIQCPGVQGQEFVVVRDGARWTAEGVGTDLGGLGALASLLSTKWSHAKAHHL